MDDSENSTPKGDSNEQKQGNKLPRKKWIVPETPAHRKPIDPNLVASESTPRKGGRFATKYKEEYCLELINHLKDGGTLTSFAGRVGVSRSTVMKWKEDYPEFKMAYDNADSASFAYWLEVGKSLALGDIKGNAICWIFIMKNLFGWHDRHELTRDNMENIKINFVKKDDAIEVTPKKKQDPIAIRATGEDDGTKE